MNRACQILFDSYRDAYPSGKIAFGINDITGRRQLHPVRLLISADADAIGHLLKQRSICIENRVRCVDLILPGCGTRRFGCK